MALPTPVAYWPFNEATGTTIADASGNGHTATLVHGTWDTSALKKFGAAGLANTDGGLGASFAAINLGTVNSVAFWLNGWTSTNDGSPLGGTPGVAEVYLDFLQIWYTTGAGVFVNLNHGGLSGSHHVVVTRTSTTVTFYKDGALLGTATLGAGGTTSALIVNTISGRSDGNNPFVGTLDDLRLYDVALSGAQVAELYALTPPVLVPVPNVVGLTEAAAASALVAAGFVTGTVTTAPSGSVPAGQVISQSPAAGGTATIGSAVDLVISAGPAGWKVLVDGVDQTARVTACAIQWTLNERTRASVAFNDYLPDRLAEIVSYARDGVTKLFGGVILSRHVEGYTQAGPDLRVTCECGDYFAYADWVTVAASYPESTLKTRLAALVADYLSAYGITLDGAQVDGPAVAPVTWNQKRVSDALRELSSQTGYFLTVSPDKVLTMAPPGEASAPYVWTDTAPTHVQEVDWRDLETVPANKVVLTCGPNGLATIADEHHWGDGSTRIFPLNSPYVAVVGALRTGSDAGGLDPGGFPVGTYGTDDLPWTYDATINALRQRTDQPILAADAYLVIWYSAQFPFTVTATTGATPVIEYHEARPELLSIPAAQQIADELLANMSGDPMTLHGRFDEDGYQVGQLLTVSLAAMRQIAGTFTIRAITLDLVLATYWRYSLDATEGAIAAPSHLVGWRKIIGEGYAIPGPWTPPPESPPRSPRP